MVCKMQPPRTQEGSLLAACMLLDPIHGVKDWGSKQLKSTCPYITCLCIKIYRRGHCGQADCKRTLCYELELDVFCGDTCSVLVLTVVTVWSQLKTYLFNQAFVDLQTDET